MNDNIEKAIESASQIVLEARSLGIDTSSQADKLQKAVGAASDDVVTIALLGGFSDGKTTIISALQGRVLDGMKISSDESSNEIIHYSTDFLGKQFRIVDTPGLFGYKTEGRTKLSDITVQYISEADVVIYVTEACNPLPESHQENLKSVMRDLGKLNDAIFVINKMDQTDCELDDEESFSEAVAVKTDNLRQRLVRCLNLSDAEAAKLEIVCVAANPNDKDLSFWFEKKPERYNKLSHIDNLRKSIINSTASIDVVALKQETSLAMAKDAVLCIERIAHNIQESASAALRNARNSQMVMEERLADLRAALAQEQKSVAQAFDELMDSVNHEINTATLETLNDVLCHLGTNAEGNVDFSNVIRMIDDELLACSTSAASAITNAATDIEVEAVAQNQFLNDAAKKGIDWLGQQKISPELVNKVRDMFFKNFKFKPWGKIKLAGNLTKWLGWGAAGLGVIMEAYSLYKEHQAAKKLDEARIALRSANTAIFNQVRELYGSPEAFYKNFGAGYIELQEEVEDRKHQLEEINTHNDKVSSVLAKIESWKDEYFYEDVEYEDI